MLSAEFKRLYSFDCFTLQSIVLITFWWVLELIVYGVK